MNQRQMSIIDLLKDNKWLTGKELSKLLGVTDRTIRNDIKRINEEKDGEFIISSKKHGYSLKDLENTLKRNIHVDQDRDKYIIKEILNNEDSISYDDLLNTLYVSDTGIMQSIADINKYISKYNNLAIRKRNDKIYLDGDELSIRYLYKELLFEETRGNIYNLDEIANFYDSFDLLKVKKTLERILDKYEYDINIYSYPLLIIHLGVILDRIIKNKALNDFPLETKLSNDLREASIASEFFEEISPVLDIEIPEAEFKFFTYILYTNKRTNNLMDIDNDQVYDTIENLLIYLDKLIGINFNKDDELKQNLYLHIKALLERTNSHINRAIENIYLKDLMRNNPFIYDIAVLSSNFLESNLNIKINNEEIPFIAIHLGTAYQRLYTNKFKTVLIMPNTKSLSYQMYERISNVFSDDIQIVGTYTYFEEDKFRDKDIDLIISSIPIYHNLNISTVTCSIFFNNEDEVHIFKAIKELEEKKLQKNFKKHLGDLFEEKFFYTNMNFDNKKDLIKFLCDNLYENSYVEKDYYDKVIERENYGPTSFSNAIAIPHSIDTESINKSIVSVLILDKPIKWDDYEVSIVFLLTIENYRNQALKIFFSWMNNIVSDFKKFTKIIESEDFNSFIENFIDINEQNMY